MKRKATRHTSLTQNAGKVAAALRKAGLRPHPGRISARSGSGGALRVKITADPGRTRIRVSGGGVQELFIYGAVNLKSVQAAIVRRLGSDVIESIVERTSE